MTTQTTATVWLTDDARFTLAELAELACITEDDVRELVDYGALAPLDAAATPWIFSGRCLTTIRTACRLRLTFDLEPHGVALIVSLLERIEALEAELGHLRAQLPQHSRNVK